MVADLDCLYRGSRATPNQTEFSFLILIFDAKRQLICWGTILIMSDRSSETASNIKIGLLGMCRRSYNQNERRRNILSLERVGFATVLCSHNHTSVSYLPHIEQVSDSTVSVRIY